MADPGRNLLITATELDALLRKADAGAAPQLLDTRPAEQFAAGRIPGAIHLELWGLSLNDSDPEPTRAFFWTLSHYLTTRGIDPARPVIVYEDDSGMRAARAFWLLEYFGHPDVRLLDGGFQAWTRAGLPVETGAAAVAPSNDPARDPDTLPRWPDDGQTARREEVLACWRDVFAASVIDFINTNRDRYLDELKQYLAIPSVSALPEHADDVRRCAEWTAGQMRHRPRERA
jgi:3-mercaptopyruvate sulfurtransferase SseA